MTGRSAQESVTSWWIRPRARRAITLVGALLAGTALSGCTKPQPTVTWYGNRTAVNVGPALYCDLTDQLTLICPETEGPIARLPLHPEDAVQVNIPPEIAERPWLLVISTTDGSPSYRTPIMQDGQTLSYLVRPLDGHPIGQIDLQVLTVTAAADGVTPQFTPYQAWVLVVDPIT